MVELFVWFNVHYHKHEKPGDTVQRTVPPGTVLAFARFPTIAAIVTVAAISSITAIACLVVIAV